MMISKTRKMKPSVSAHSTTKVSQAENVPSTIQNLAKKLSTHGDKGPNGCILGHETCPFFHSKMCKNSLGEGECSNPECKLRHFTGTRCTQHDPGEGNTNRGHEEKKKPQQSKASASFLEAIKRLRMEIMSDVDERIAHHSTYSNHPTPNDVSSTNVQPKRMVSQYNVPDDAWTNHTISRCCLDDTTPSMVLAHFSILNIQRLTPLTVSSKAPYLQDLLHDSNQLFLGLTEAWLREHLDVELNIEGYSLFRQDQERNKKKGRASRGVAFYIRNDIAVNTQTVLQKKGQCY